MDSNGKTVKGLLERFRDKEVVLAGEGYLTELERRGYLSSSSFVPLVVLDHPVKVEQLSRELSFNGSDITLALSYNVAPKCMELAGRSDDYEKINRQALQIAKKVATETNTLFGSSVTKLRLYDPDDRNRTDIPGLPCVVTLATANVQNNTLDGYDLIDAFVMLEKEGADCVGLNCSRGPETMIPLIREARKHVKGPLACLSVGYRTSEKEPVWVRLTHPLTNKPLWPDDISSNAIGYSDVQSYAEQCKEIGVDFVGFRCGNAPSYMRMIAEAYCRTVQSSM